MVAGISFVFAIEFRGAKAVAGEASLVQCGYFFIGNPNIFAQPGFL
jgi:hypothetical protein